MSRNQKGGVPNVAGDALSPSDQVWLDAAAKAASGSVDSIEEAARQLITITTALSTLYFAVLTVSTLKQVLSALRGPAFWALLFLFLAPLLCWVFSLWACALVFHPETYLVNLDSPELAQAAMLEMASYKHARLRRAYSALFAGLGFLVAGLLAYLIIPIP